MEKHNLFSQNGFMEFYKRELGFSRPTIFSRRISASEALVKRIDLYTKLIGHGGCVNTITFNSTGDHLVSGSDDRRIIFWEWETKTMKFDYPSGHVNNVFDSRIMPFTDDRKIVTCAADGKVRLGEVLENGVVQTKRIGKHRDRAHKLAVEPGSPYILYSCGEDGLVQRFDLRSDSSTKLFCCSSYSVNNKRVRLNTIVINPTNPHQFSTGGSDRLVRVYDVRKYQVDCTNDQDFLVDTFCPQQLIDSQSVHITSLAYSKTNELLVSYNDESIYLFQKNMGLGTSPSSVRSENLQNLEAPQVYSGHRNSQTVKGVNFFGPNDEYVMSGSDCGHIFIWKKKDAKLIRMMLGDSHIVNQVEPNPHCPVIATSGIEKNIKIWAPTSDDSFLPLPHNVEELMEANRRGRAQHSGLSMTPDVLMRIIRLHRRQAMGYDQPAPDGDEIENDEDNEADRSYVLSYADGESEEGLPDNGTECTIC